MATLISRSAMTSATWSMIRGWVRLEIPFRRGIFREYWGPGSLIGREGHWDGNSGVGIFTERIGKVRLERKLTIEILGRVGPHSKLANEITWVDCRHVSVVLWDFNGLSRVILDSVDYLIGSICEVRPCVEAVHKEKCDWGQKDLNHEFLVSLDVLWSFNT